MFFIIWFVRIPNRFGGEEKRGEGVYCEIYIDVLFLVNFMMDYLLLSAERKMLAFSSGQRRVFFGAASGAFLTCLAIALPLPAAGKQFLFHAGIPAAMLFSAFPVRTAREFAKAFFMLYTGGFLLGGIFGFFRQYIRTGSLFFLCAVISYELLNGIWEWIRHMARLREYTCRAEINMQGKKVLVRGLIDTGNGLYDRETGKPVCIVEKDAVRTLLSASGEGRVRYIGCRSVGENDGVMPLVRFDSLRILGKKEKEIRDIWIGVTDTKISGNGSFELIIHPGIF